MRFFNSRAPPKTQSVSPTWHDVESTLALDIDGAVTHPLDPISCFQQFAVQYPPQTSNVFPYAPPALFFAFDEVWGIGGKATVGVPLARSKSYWKFAIPPSMAKRGAVCG